MKPPESRLEDDEAAVMSRNASDAQDSITALRQIHVNQQVQARGDALKKGTKTVNVSQSIQLRQRPFNRKTFAP